MPEYQLTFYDISSPIQPQSYAPNPSKSRLALGFKGVPFQTTFVDLPDIANVRKGLKCPAIRKFDDGSDFYTLPMLHVVDQSSHDAQVVGDSFLIATWLDEAFPDSGAGRLFPQDARHIEELISSYESPFKDTPLLVPLTSIEGFKHPAYAKFNIHIDATFTAYVSLVAEFIPFNPESSEVVKATFAKRAHLNSWEELPWTRGEARQKQWAAFKDTLTPLAKLITTNDPNAGPFIGGRQTATYADLIIGGWLNMFSVCAPEEEWKEFRTWHGKVFARLHDALHEKYYVCK